MLDEGIIFGVDALEGSVTVENISTETLIFKVKTTNPDKFRVSPPAGQLASGQLERITVTLVHGQGLEDASASRDKFLIMCKPLEADDIVPIERIHSEFKQQGGDVEQHRIRCIYPMNTIASGASQEGNVARTTALRNGSQMRFFGGDGEDRSRGSDEVS